ncbi:rRNA maturation RNase YbeY [Lactobacillus mulieris]|uniref:rRNA maturation RNase YbeY n=1 Tax=Lactobacillus mulieris TaxID=2508708 RepID=UPI001432BB39|nr:rRNA maturation RNase YbeY [Lactobacillus mulieris]MCF1782892.1 rRNA maturation RNase YbeY [Lactobacillus mulieris]MCW8103853.1 rRNA maturation RNase YbeY [Lactobacillus mulieris]MDK6802612.1 rRNA maturation RNase YbeY [Lactobacillus mulieris]MDK8381728.1 rRNA maturation RNase YbeY [Lactobacillus mulieris]MDT9619938.1 rRNA maturation RNase YbeY [Lactobacillus mulieris]
MDAIDITFNDETNFLVDTSRDWRKWIMDLLLMAKKEISKDNNLEMSINFIDEDKSHQINRDYRGKDRPTDVISFAIEDGEEGVDLSGFIEDPDFTEDIGDLFMCISVIKRHAEEYGTGFDREFGYTLVHGFLHLNGYDHIEPVEAKEMFGIQGKVLEEYGLPLYPDQLDEGRGK